MRIAGVAVPRPGATADHPNVIWRSATAAAWPVGFVALVYLLIGRLGFYPTDEGLVQAYAYRILRGEVPHRDFVSPRPLGSALIHLVDFALPGPLFENSRILALAEYAAYSILLAWLIYELAPWRWGTVGVLGAAGSALVNLNIFPLMPWYTVDGLLFVAAGYVVIARGVRIRSRRDIAVGFVVVGLAAVTKQSFVPAALIGWFLLWPWLAELAWSGRVRAVISTGVLAAAPLVLFIAVIAGLGGFSAMRTQLLGGEIVYGRELLSAWSPRHDLWVIAPIFLAAAALSTGTTWRHEGWSTLSRIALSILAIGVPLWSQLGISSLNWSIEVAWILIAFVLTRAVLQRSVDVTGAVLIGVTWMAMLSWGWAWPTFTAGTAVLYVLDRTWRGSPVPRPIGLSPDVSAVIAAVLVLALTAGVFVTTREQRVYLDRPASDLTASLSDISPAFGAIRTNQQTHAYLTEIVNCIRQYPARQVAVLPENAAIYPALRLDNPFPIDWMWPDDIRGSELRILAAADKLNREGDYLVLFQTLGQRQVVGTGTLPPAVLGQPVYGDTSLVAQIYARLNGQRSVCGSFLVVYAPA